MRDRSEQRGRGRRTLIVGALGLALSLGACGANEARTGSNAVKNAKNAGKAAGGAIATCKLGEKC